MAHAFASNSASVGPIQPGLILIRPSVPTMVQPGTSTMPQLGVPQPTVINSPSGPVVRVPFIRLPVQPGKDATGKDSTTVLLLPKQLANLSPSVSVQKPTPKPASKPRPIAPRPLQYPLKPLPSLQSILNSKVKKKRMVNKCVSTDDPTVNRKRNSFSVDDKVKLLDRMKETKANQIANELSIPASTLFAIKRNEGKIRLMHASKSKAVKRKSCTNIYLAKLETRLIEWIRKSCQDKVVLNDRKVREKAIEMYDELPLEFGVPKPNFRGSNGWMRQFRRRAYPEIENQKSRIGMAIKQIALKAPTPIKVFKQTVKLLIDQEIVGMKPSTNKGLWKELLNNNGQVNPIHRKLAKHLSPGKKKRRPKKAKTSDGTTQSTVPQEQPVVTINNEVETIIKPQLIPINNNNTPTTQIVEITGFYAPHQEHTFPDDQNKNYTPSISSTIQII